MEKKNAIWLVNNASSGSNDETALTKLESCCGDQGFHVAHRTVFPAQDLPTPALLDVADVQIVVVFAGDGTVNALIEQLSGWTGSILVLAGGTMNLLYHRLHGNRTLEDVVAAAAGGHARRYRPGVVRSRLGVAYAGVLAGPGASWGDVREAMRDKAVLDVVGTTVSALQQTLGNELIACTQPPLGRPTGYPLINLTPNDAGIEVDAYLAESAGEYLGQAMALLKRDFRQGPHERLGTPQQVRLASTNGEPFGLLIDGEQVECGAEELFELVTCEVDLLAAA